eukprot:CAMPEP_0175827506 /NCGR_PEP_ID=MMETSP0107_2-20121207/12320_1 /TAXON_ID=195067 ORGANISM="Goniomonas pacifica, Strain CCMP1869" /NCGR_SAMPLE_ID=MMETSP0107_2 /ASSEMBLY_ACC=CAM_ASM_000203 /LENGTH=135 /DNA_ID=CAMNT_0017140187 /DNA_START=327 /DNA_END=735 /DNA_ORIENTATION=-
MSLQRTGQGPCLDSGSRRILLEFLKSEGEGGTARPVGVGACGAAIVGGVVEVDVGKVVAEEVVPDRRLVGHDNLVSSAPPIDDPPPYSTATIIVVTQRPQRRIGCFRHHLADGVPHATTCLVKLVEHAQHGRGWW